MALFDAVRGTVGNKPDLRIEQALEIVGAYGLALERAKRAPGHVSDSADLPYPKDTIKWAILQLLAAIPDPAKREPLRVGYVALAEWQDLEQLAAVTFDSMRLRRKLDPLSLAREFAARTTPEDRCAAASRAEQQLLIAELRKKGFW
jgi:hypothetical protein